MVLRPNGLALSCAAPIDRESHRAASSFQNCFDLARRSAASACVLGRPVSAFSDPKISYADDRPSIILLSGCVTMPTLSTAANHTRPPIVVRCPSHHYWRARVAKSGLTCFDPFVKLLDSWQDLIANYSRLGQEKTGRDLAPRSMGRPKPRAECGIGAHHTALNTCSFLNFYVPDLLTLGAASCVTGPPGHGFALEKAPCPRSACPWPDAPR